MNIAALGDIHGNLPALKAILEDIRSQHADEIWCHGDIVYGGPWPEECAQLIRSSADVITKGNTDHWVALRGFDLHPPSGAGRLAGEPLSASSIEWLSELPEGHQGPGDLVLTHATRRSIEGRFPRRDAPPAEWLELFGPPPATVVCGHVHVAFVKRVEDLAVVNTGSAGAPFDGDPRATYLVIRGEPGDLSFEHRRVDYDREAVALAAEPLSDFGKLMASTVRTGRRG